MQSNYYACQIHHKDGYKMSTLEIVHKNDINKIENKLKWEPINITDEEYEPIKQRWNSHCVPRQNRTIEKWIKLLNIDIRKYRESLIQPNEIHYEEIIDDSNQNKIDLENFGQMIKKYIDSKSNEFIMNHNNKVKLSMVFNIEGFFDE